MKDLIPFPLDFIALFRSHDNGANQRSRLCRYICENIVSSTAFDAVAIYLTNQNYLKLEAFYSGAAGGEKWFCDLDSSIEINSCSAAGLAVLRHQEVNCSHLLADGKIFPCQSNRFIDALAAGRIEEICAIPIVNKSSVSMILQLIRYSGSQQNRTIFSAPTGMEMRKFTIMLAETLSFIPSKESFLLSMLEGYYRDFPAEDLSHLHRVAKGSKLLYLNWARKHGIPGTIAEQVADRLSLAAILHDIGKITVCRQILDKPGKLSREELYLMQCHTVNGAGLFGNSHSRLSQLTREIVLRHHEWWNDDGYPGDFHLDNEANPMIGKGLSGQQIPILARMVAIVDVYDSLLSKRSYKIPWSRDEAEAEIVRQSGVQFDPELTELFVRQLPDFHKISLLWNY